MWRLIKFLTKFSKYISATNILETISCYLPKNFFIQIQLPPFTGQWCCRGWKRKGLICYLVVLRLYQIKKILGDLLTRSIFDTTHNSETTIG